MDKVKFNNAVEALAASLEKQSNLHLHELRTHLEKYLTDYPYQIMAVYQRNRHHGEKGENWPYKPASVPAISRYPNILAEMDASGWWLDRIAGFAQVSMEIMAATMDDNGALSLGELRRLTRCFGCKLEYLAAPVLSMVDPATNKGRIRLWHLKDLEQQTEGMDRFIYQLDSSDVLPKLESGKPVTYAAYRWACKHLQDVLDMEARKEARQRSIRTGELSPAKPLKKAQMDPRTRIKQARERYEIRKMEDQLARIRKYVEDTKMETDCDGRLKDLYALADFSRRDLFGAIFLAIVYGQAQGYRAAKEVIA